MAQATRTSPRPGSPLQERLAENVFRETVFVFISVQYILRVLSETEAIVYSKFLMRTEQEKEGPRVGRGLGAQGGEWSRARRQRTACELCLLCFLRLKEFLKERGRGEERV